MSVRSIATATVTVPLSTKLGSARPICVSPSCVKACISRPSSRPADCSTVVGIFPNEESIMRLLGTVLTEQNEE